MISETREECEYQFLNYAERVFSDEIRTRPSGPMHCAATITRA